MFEPVVSPSTTMIAYEWPATWKVRSSTDPRTGPNGHAARPGRLDPDRGVVVPDVADQRTEPERARRWSPDRVASMVDGSVISDGVSARRRPSKRGSDRLPHSCNPVEMPAPFGGTVGAAPACNARDSRQAHSERASAHHPEDDHSNAADARRVVRRVTQEDGDVDRAAGAHRAADCDRRPRAGPLGAGGERIHHDDVRPIVAWYLVALAGLIGFVGLTVFIASHGVVPFDGRSSIGPAPTAPITTCGTCCPMPPTCR